LWIGTIVGLFCIGVLASLGQNPREPWKSVGIIAVIIGSSASLRAFALAIAACRYCGGLKPRSSTAVLDRRRRETIGYRTEVTKHYDKNREYTGESRRSVPYTYTAAEVLRRTDYTCSKCGRTWSSEPLWIETDRD